MILQALCVLLLIPATVATGYYLLLAVVGLLGRGRSPVLADAATQRFAILIPAHNEEHGLPATLRSCAALDYPRDRFDVYVIADNCHDGTAEVARGHGVTCWERHDTEQHGKGQALAWGLERLLPARPDAVLILDADCQIDAHALRAFDHGLSRGDQVVQANYVASNPDDSGISYAVAVGNLLENELFYAPKSDLGLTVLLRGTGMLFRREVLERFPWSAYSVVEDAEYSLRLLDAGIPVRYLAHTRVTSAFPSVADQLTVQRQRWAAGNLQFSKTHSLRLCLRGRFDAALTLLVFSRPLVLLQLLLTVVACGLTALAVPNALSFGLLGMAVGLLAGQALYVALGVGLLGVTRHRLGLLASSAGGVLRLTGIVLQSLVSKAPQLWTRTPRLDASALPIGVVCDTSPKR